MGDDGEDRKTKRKMPPCSSFLSDKGYPGEGSKVSEIRWEIERKDDLEIRLPGSHHIGSDRNDLNERSYRNCI